MENNDIVYYCGDNPSKHGELYTIIEYNSKYKCVTTKLWKPCVIYKNNNDGEIYVRDFIDFNNNFKKIEK